MRRSFILLLGGLIISGLVVLGLYYDTGYVLVTFGHWRLEANLWVWLTLNIVGLLLLFLVFYVIGNLGKGAFSFVRWAKSRPKVRAEQETEQGFIAYLEGDWATAQKLLTKSAPHARNPQLNFLASAHAASENGNQKDAAKLLKKAHGLNNKSDLAITLTQARLHIDNQRYEAALAALSRLKHNFPKKAYIYKLLCVVYERLEDWERLLETYSEMRAHHMLEKNADDSLERLAWTRLFAQHTEKLVQNCSYEEIAEQLAEVWKRIPEKLRFDEQIIFGYAQQLLRLNQHQEAETLLRKTLDKHWSENLIDTYGRTRSNDPREQLLHAEKWLKERPNSPRLLLALGRICLQNELWGKALDYLNASQSLARSHEGAAELCRLYQSMDKQNEAMQVALNDLMTDVTLPTLPQPNQ